MAPIFKNQPVQGTGENASAGYHGYWITDFTQVDPHFGTNQDLKNLISKAHAKGMKVFFDVITNHTADVVDYEEKSYDYLSKGAFPYLTKDGEPFDDADYAKGDRRFRAWTPAPSRVRRSSPPPRRTSRSRGGSTTRRCTTTAATPPGPASPPPTATSPASTTLWTERPEVVDGMEKIYQRWVKDFAIDGFRIDTVKHVDMEFWTQWATALDAYAAKKGRDDFFMFGEVYSADTAVTSPYVTQGRLDSTLDFPSRTRPAATPPRAAAPGSSRPSSVTTGSTRPTRPTPTSRSPSSATTTWAASAQPSSSRTTRRPPTPNC